MLAYSSISHAGFMLLGVQAGTVQGQQGVLVYLATYLFVVLGSFTVVSIVGGSRDASHALSDYRGLARRRPLLAFVFTVLLLAQAGVPTTSGFIAKFGVIVASAKAESYPLAVLAMIAAAIAAFFYLRLVLVMYSTPAGAQAVASHDDGIVPLDELTDAEVRAQGRDTLVIPFASKLVLTASIAVTVAVGLFPALVFNLADAATLALR
jgi:NADH-quinone oxidoreductase subunit N